jgi:16S rRNA (cytosine1402-N4)-methyltransferase
MVGTPIGPPTRIDPPADTRMRVRGSMRVRGPLRTRRQHRTYREFTDVRLTPAVVRSPVAAAPRPHSISTPARPRPYDASYSAAVVLAVDSLYLLPPIGSAMTAGSTQHVPVLAQEVLEGLSPLAGQTIVDGTLGGGGHARLLAEAVGPTGRVIGLDRDAGAVERTAERLRGLPAEGLRGIPVECLHGNYADLPEVLASLGIAAVDGILLDLGLSSDQLADIDRGFSFNSTGPLDLRFDTTRGEPAWRLLERLSEEHLANVIFQYGEERYSRRIARAIVARRGQSPVRTAEELAEVIRRSVPRSRHDRIDPATRSFQALRIEVNEELKWVKVGLRRLPECLRPGGRLVVISFHSLEDRLVKEAFREDDRLDVITRRPVRATDAETNTNPRSRSAKLRVAARNTQPAEITG